MSLKGRKLTTEHKQKISQAQLGSKHYFYGKKRSEEYKKKMSEVTKGVKNHFFGKTHTLETRQKIIESNKRRRGEKRSLEARKNIGDGRRGIKHTEESKKLISLHSAIRGKHSWNKGKPWSAESKAKMSRARQFVDTIRKNTKIELILQNMLTELDIKFETQHKIVGRPDIFIEDLKIAIFADGNYWHANPLKYAPDDIMINGQTAQEIWDRDNIINTELAKMECYVLRFWESDIVGDPDFIKRQIQTHIKHLKLVRPNA